MPKILKSGQTGTVMIEHIDCKSIITRDLSDEDRSARAIADYAEAYASKQKLPPVHVFLVDGQMVLVDGDHRVEARLVIRKASVVAECVGEGTMDDALRYALKNTNQAHGLRLSPADCKRRVFQALDSGLWDSPSANALGADLGISHHTAGKYMAEWEAARGIQGPVERLDTKGRRQPAKKPKNRVDDVGTANVSEPSAKQPRARTVIEPEPDAGHPPDDVPDIVDEPDPFEDVPALADCDEDTNRKPVHKPEAGTQTATPIPPVGEKLLTVAKEIKRVRALARKVLGDELSTHAQSAEEGLRRVEYALRYAVPETCPKCGGPGCDHCRRRGWVDRATAEQIRSTAKVLGKETAA